MSYPRRPSPHELPRVPKDDDLFATPAAPSPTYAAELAVLRRIRAARPGAYWAVGVDHKGVWAIVDGHEVRARQRTCAQVLQMALEKALAA